MARRKVFIVLTTIALLALTSPSFPQAPAVDVSVAWARFTARHGTAWQAPWDPVLGTLQSLRGGLYPPLAGNPEQAARRFLIENQDLFQAPADLPGLSL